MKITSAAIVLASVFALSPIAACPSWATDADEAVQTVEPPAHALTCTDMDAGCDSTICFAKTGRKMSFKQYKNSHTLKFKQRDDDGLHGKNIRLSIGIGGAFVY